jgi:hypothetical protein
MFERFTEKARRVVFFGRYEASMYGSPYIETEHFLLGLLREDPKVADLLPNTPPLDELRREIEKHIKPRERISTSVEIPLTSQCKRILNFAAEEAERLGHHHVGTEHLLLGILREKNGLAAAIVHADKIDLNKLRMKLSGTRNPTVSARISVKPTNADDGKLVVENFLVALRDGTMKDLHDFFAADSCFVDASGKLWRGQNEIVPNLEILLAPFAKRNAKTADETHTSTSATVLVATLIWEDVHIPGFSPLDLFRMSIVFGSEEDIPIVYLIQITPIGREALGKIAAT